jgi:hypothetical protein
MRRIRLRRERRLRILFSNNGRSERRRDERLVLTAINPSRLDGHRRDNIRCDPLLFRCPRTLLRAINLSRRDGRRLDNSRRDGIRRVCILRRRLRMALKANNLTRRTRRPPLRRSLLPPRRGPLLSSALATS